MHVTYIARMHNIVNQNVFTVIKVAIAIANGYYQICEKPINFHVT